MTAPADRLTAILKPIAAINRLRKMRDGRDAAFAQMKRRGLSRKELHSATLAHDRDVAALDFAIAALRRANLRSVK